jgi:hypothetical protein
MSDAVIQLRDLRRQYDMGGEIIHAFRDDQISQMAHLVGGTVGAAFGFVIAGKKAGALPKGSTSSELQKILSAPAKRKAS